MSKSAAKETNMFRLSYIIAVTRANGYRAFLVESRCLKAENLSEAVLEAEMLKKKKKLYTLAHDIDEQKIESGTVRRNVPPFESTSIWK